MRLRCTACDHVGAIFRSRPGWAIVAAAMIFAFGAAMQSADAAPRSASVWLLADANKRFSVSGSVESVSYVSNSVHLNAEGQHLKILITPTTAIETRGEGGSISDIRRGSRITVTGVIRGGAWVANSVVVH